ncbi:MAG TPA: response regulator [Gammaproteobacteria bacterium]|nr:response regulator [Gammaproteobacteria bacterium]
MNNDRKKARILVVDDVPDNIRMLIEILKDDFATIPATSGKGALEKLKNTDIDLVLLDILMPVMDGYETCRAIKENPHSAAIPVIFITALSEVMDDAKGFEVGAVDYISKPFNPSTVRARVKNQIKLCSAIKELEELYKVALDSNPISGLPGNNSIRNRIDALILENSETVVVYADLDNFKAFNDQYGFAHGDEVLLFTSAVFRDVMKNLPAEHSFLGHIGGDDFVLLVPLQQINQTIDNIIAHFDEGIRKFYSNDDLVAGYITSINRHGEKQKFPIMSISMAGVNLAQKKYQHYLSVVDACTEIKKLSKEQPGSSFVVDQREK